MRTRDICYEWIRSNNGSAKASSLSYEDDALYSYTKIIGAKRVWNGQTVVVVNNHNYSVTTSRHQRYLLQAANGHSCLRGVLTYDAEKVGHTPRSVSLEMLETFYEEKLEQLLSDFQKTKSLNKRSNILWEAHRIANERHLLTVLSHNAIKPYNTEALDAAQTEFDELEAKREQLINQVLTAPAS